MSPPAIPSQGWKFVEKVKCAPSYGGCRAIENLADYLQEDRIMYAKRICCHAAYVNDRQYNENLDLHDCPQ